MTCGNGIPPILFRTETTLFHSSGSERTECAIQREVFRPRDFFSRPRSQCCDNKIVEDCLISGRISEDPQLWRTPETTYELKDPIRNFYDK